MTTERLIVRVTKQAWRLWRATTNLDVTLYDGGRDAGPMVGAGILNLEVRNLVGLPEPLRNGRP